MSEIDKRSTPQKVKDGLFWVVVGPVGLGLGLYESNLVWKPIGPHLDPIWVTYGPVLAHVRVFGLLLDYCWLVPYCSLLSLVALFPCLGSPLRYVRWSLGGHPHRACWDIFPFHPKCSVHAQAHEHK